MHSNTNITNKGGYKHSFKIRMTHAKPINTQEIKKKK